MKIPLNRLVNRDQFPHWLNDNGFSGKGVEVGTFEGEYAAHLGRCWQGHLTTIDPYDWQTDPTYLDGCASAEAGKVMKVAIARLADFPRVTMLCSRSPECAYSFPNASLDFGYLDGNHSPLSMVNELDAWWPKVRPGGILCGHDFYDRDDEYQSCGVATAVWDFSDRIGIRPHVTFCTSWWIQKI